MLSSDTCSQCRTYGIITRTASPTAACCRTHSPEDGRLLQSLRYHKDLVTCVAASSGEAPRLLPVWGQHDFSPGVGGSSVVGYPARRAAPSTCSPGCLF